MTEPPEIDHDPNERPKDIIEYAIDIVVGIGGMALMIYLKANYAHDLGHWMLSFF